MTIVGLLFASLPGIGLSVDIVQPQVVGSIPHDRSAFTQGLLFHDGYFYESTGRYGNSSLRRVDANSGDVLHSIDINQRLFGEGLARVGDQLIQLTWKTGKAIRYRQEDFSVVAVHDYAGEGWGLCFDGQRIVMSNGTSKLMFRDPKSFTLLGEIEVRKAGRPVTRLNELECVGKLVYANVWQSDSIMRIDPATGEVLTEIDISGLLSAKQARRADVPNGIAFDPATRHFYLTGKYWPRIFEVSFTFDPGRQATQ